MAVGDIYKVVTQYAYLNGVIANRFFYRQKSGADSDANNVSQAWQEDIYPALRLVQSTQLALVNITVTNLMNPVDFVDDAIIGAVGDRAGEVEPPFVTWRFKLLRASRVFRTGRKAIGGVASADIADGVAAPALLPLLDDAAAALAANMNTAVSPGNVYEPMLVREIVGLPPLEFTEITDAQYVEVSTQSTRKFNRGI